MAENDGDKEVETIPEIHRVVAIPVFRVEDQERPYILLLKNKSRGDWEFPGGERKFPYVALDAVRETIEEMELELYPVTMHEIPEVLRGHSLEFNNKFNLTGGRGKIDIRYEIVVSTYEVDQLPELGFNSESEHTDYLYIRWPDWDAKDARPAHNTLLDQIAEANLLLKQTSEHVRVMTIGRSGDLYSISELTQSALRKYAYVTFGDIELKELK